MTESRAVISSPVGQLMLAASGNFLTEIRFLNGVVAPETPQNGLLSEAEKQITAYFEGKLTSFDLPFLARGTEFQRRVWKALLEIPFGCSWSYKQLALFLGDIKCIRAAGTANGKNPLPLVIPCHRVIGSDGSLVGYGGGLWRKRWFLKHEKHPHYLFRQGELFN